MRRHSLIVTTFVVLVVGLAGLALGADDPFNGTWKLNLTKSKIPVPPPGLPPQSVTADYDFQGKILKMVSDIDDPEGRARHSESSVFIDGKDHPSTMANAETQLVRRLDVHTVSGVFKHNGEVGREP